MLARVAPARASHLRHVSTSSNDTVRASSVRSSHDTRPDTAPPVTYRLCTLWVHDDSFSKEETLFNPSIFEGAKVNPGDLVEIVALKASTDVRDFQQSSAPGGRLLVLGTENESSAPVPLQNAAKGWSNIGGSGNFSVNSQTRYVSLFRSISAEIKSKHPSLQVSLTSAIANTFGFRNRAQVLVSLTDRDSNAASHVELTFRDQYLARADMWRMAISELVGKTVYKGQKILFLGTIRASIKNIYVNGRKTSAAYFSDKTVPVFRSESARYVLFIQMSKEMWDFDSEGTGEILFSRVIDGFLPDLFKRWADIEARHLVTIVMFGRLEYDRYPSAGLGQIIGGIGGSNEISKVEQPASKDFYRVVVSDMASGRWTSILNALKKEFRTFLRDVSIQAMALGGSGATTGSGQAGREKSGPIARICGRPSTALRGNILEAINIASSQFANDYIDRDLVRTGISVVVITPGTGVFEVDHDLLALTTDNLTSNGIGIDLVCLSKMPLHSVPLFKYRSPRQRRSSVGSRDSRQSPPGLHRLPGSIPNRFLGVSPSASTAFGSSVGSSFKFNYFKPDTDWLHGIPHWIDVSFWAQGTGQKKSNSSAARTILDLSTYANTKDSTTFVPRVRMYELQMMGVMELGLANISIPYLSEGSQGLQKRSKQEASTQHLKSRRSNKLLLTQGSPYRSHLGSTGRPDPFLNSRPHKKGVMTAHSKHPRNMIDRMDEYDSYVFRTRARNVLTSSVLQRRASQQTMPRVPENSQVLEVNTPKLISNEIPSEARSTVADQSRLGDASPSGSIRTPADAQLTKVLKSSNAKPSPSRLSRSISFALRGLGGPPRAGASTEVNAEHATAGSMVTGSTLSRGLSQGSIAAASADSQSQISQNRMSVDSDASDERESHLSSSRPAASPSRPISIKTASRKSQAIDIAHPGVDSINSFSTAQTKLPSDHKPDESINTSDADARTQPKLGTSVGSETRERSPAPAPSTGLSPWIKTVNPSNPAKNDPNAASWFGRWQHVYPHKPRASSVKWRSLCTPASVPLTTEEFPSRNELESEYSCNTYTISRNDDREVLEVPKPREALVREMVALRLSHGYQLVVGPNIVEYLGDEAADDFDVFDTASMAKEGRTIFMSMGDTIQRLVCAGEGAIEVTKYKRKMTSEGSEAKKRSLSYPAHIKTILGEDFIARSINLAPFNEEYNWNGADAYLAGHKDHLVNKIEQLRFWRARFVLIPVEPPANSRRPLQTMSEDNEEEIHLLGIAQLTQMWQRYRHVPAEDRRFQPSTGKKKDPNPLDIMYQTRNPSEVVAAELDRLLLSDAGGESWPTQLLPESELFQRSNLGLPHLAQTIQGEKGVEMRNRRWHWRLHYNCFIGTELTTWMLENFRDIDTREEAVEFGNELMKHGLFVHVEKRHNFRDGNYFYQIVDKYRSPRPESRNSWFPARRLDKSVPSTPMIDSVVKDSPMSSRARSDSAHDNESSDSGARTPTKEGKGRTSIYLSKEMRLDVDPRKRSNRPEIINLHYDRLHNPENCYHLEISWIDATSKLIEDAIVSWATMAEKYGLKLVEVPITEASAIETVQPFRAPYRVTLKARPPNAQPINYFNATSFSPQTVVDRHFYQKALLKKFHFVLDLEAASDFPPDVDVAYSWGKLEYRYPQFIHRSGIILAQITDDGNFLLLANRLYNTRSAASKDASKFDRMHDHQIRRQGPVSLVTDRPSPHLSPLVRASSDVLGASLSQTNLSNWQTPETIKDELEAFCSDQSKLEAFYREVPAASKGSSSSNAIRPTQPPGLDTSIPSLQLPERLIGFGRQAQTPSPTTDANAVTGTSAQSRDSPRSTTSGK